MEIVNLTWWYFDGLRSDLGNMIVLRSSIVVVGCAYSARPRSAAINWLGE